MEWPRSVEWMESLEQLSQRLGPRSHPSRTPTVNPFAVVMRNLIFLAVVLCHGFRRLDLHIHDSIVHHTSEKEIEVSLLRFADRTMI